MLLLLLTVPVYTMFSKISEVPYYVVVVDWTHIGSAMRIEDIVQENTTADTLIEDQLQLPPQLGI